jgi:hypothetical protein
MMCAIGEISEREKLPRSRIRKKEKEKNFFDFFDLAVHPFSTDSKAANSRENTQLSKYAEL